MSDASDLWRLVPAPIRRSFLLQLVAALLVLVLLIGATGVALESFTTATVRDDVRTSLATQTAAEAESVSEWVARRELPARLLSDHAVYESGSRAEIRRYLSRHRSARLANPFVAIHFVDTRNDTIVTSTRRSAIGRTTTDLPWVERLRFSTFDDVYVSEAYESEGGETVMAFISPANGVINRVVAVVVRIDDLEDLFEHPISGGFTEVVDSTGTVIFAEGTKTTGGQYVENSSRVPEPIDQGIRGESGFVANGLRERTLDEDHVGTYAPVDGRDWVVVKHAPTGPAYALSRTIGIGIGAVIAILVAGVLLVGATVGESAVTAISDLAERAERIERGEYETTLVSDREDEIGRLSASIGTMRDTLVERLRETEVAMEAAQAQEAQLETLVQNLPVGLVVIDATGSITRTAGTTVGPFSPAEAVWLGEHYTDVFTDSPELRRPIDAALEGVSSHRVEEVAGGIFELWFEPVVDEDGALERAVAVSIDVTEREQRGQQVTVMNRVLRHNLRTHMNVIMGHITQIERSVEDERVEEHVAVLRTKTDELLDLSEKARAIQNVLTGDRIGRREFDVVRVIEEELATLTHRFPAASVDLDVPAHARIVGPEHFDVAFSELVENAIVHAEDSDPEVSVTVGVGEEVVTVAVADRGPLIPQQEREVLTRGDESPLLHGSGLGLWLVNWVVTSAGGELVFETREGGGNRVTIQFPVAA